MAETILQRRAFQTVSSSAFSNAKKLADLAIKRNVDVEGQPTFKGYEEAINILNQFQYSSKVSEAINAQRLVKGYTNTWTRLKVRRSKINKTVGEFKINEREAFYVTPTTQFRSDTMFDIPEVVADTVEELRQLVFAVSNAIDENKFSGDPSSELEKYFFELNGRYRAMEELGNDLLNEEISQEEVLNGYGVFVDADQNDGEVYGVSVAPIGNLPQGLSQGDYKRLDSTVSFGGGFVPVFSRFSVDESGQFNSLIGGRKWSGVGGLPLIFSKTNSTDKDFKDEPGEFNLQDFAPKKSTPIRPNKFFKGFTGFDEEGNPIQSLFFTSPEGTIYNIDDEAKGLLTKDFADDIDKAIGVDSEFAKSILQSENVKPLRFNMMLPEQELAPFSSPVPQQEEQVPASGSNQSFFSGRKNEPNVPDEPSGVGFSSPDIIESGKSFFRKFAEPFTNFFQNK